MVGRMSMGFQMRMRMAMAFATWPSYPDYDSIMADRLCAPEGIYSFTIPHDLLADADITSSEDSESSIIADQNMVDGEFLFADVLGKGKILESPKELEDIAKDIPRREIQHVMLPCTTSAEGLECYVALASMHQFAKGNVPLSHLALPTALEAMSRQPLPEEYIDGSPGLVLSPCHQDTHGEIVIRFAPFLFTDFEVKDPSLSAKFRRITAAELIGSILDKNRDGTLLGGAVSYRLGVNYEYNQWRAELSDKRPFADVHELKGRYPGTDLKRFF